MSKRSATSDLNHDNWNDEDEPEAPSDFKLASEEVMRKRIIKTGVRRLQGSTTPSASPFSKFSFGSATAKTASTPPTNAFSFLSNSTAAPSTNGLAATTKEPKKDDPKDNSKQNKYLAELKGLNEEFLAWIELHMKKNPACIFTPVFDDYTKYLKEIQAERDAKENGPSFGSTNSPSSGASSTPFSGFKFSSGPTALTGDIFNSSATKAKSPGAKDSEGDKPAVGGLFGSSSAGGSSFPLKTFSFGNLPSAPSETNPSTSNFNAGGSTEEETDEPPKNEFKPVTEEDAVFSQRVKVFVKKDKEDYAERGVGTLYIKPADKKYQVIVRADTNLGNLILNVILAESMPIVRMGKNNVLIVCIPLPGTDTKPLPTLLRVKNSDDANKLCDELMKYKK